MQNEILVSEELISNKIYFIRNQKVMLDSDLAFTRGGAERSEAKPIFKLCGYFQKSDKCFWTPPI